MVTIEIRRHAEAAKEGDAVGALSRQGLHTASSLATTSPRYALVVVSPRPRTQETAKAIAGRFDEINELLDVATDDVITIDEYFALQTPDVVAAFIAREAARRDFVTTQLTLWRDVASRLPDAAAGLIVAHGGNVELPAVALAMELGALPRRVPVLYLEGVRVRYKSGVPREIEPLSGPAD